MSAPPQGSPAERQALAAAGFPVEEAPAAAAEPPALWPENERPVALFVALMTQWRLGPAGPVGLDYSALPLLGGWRRLPPRHRARCLAGIQVLEAETLRVAAERLQARA